MLLSHSLQLYHTLAVSPHRKHIHWPHTHCPVAVFLQELHIPGHSVNYTKSGSKEVYNRIAGWAFDHNHIWKNNISLGSDGSIANSTKWSLNNDGSGHIASGNISWNAAGTVTFAASVSAQWTTGITTAQELASAMAFGKMLYRDPTFWNGNNGVVVYNNSQNGIPLFHTRFISINDDFDSDQHKGDTGGMDVAFKYLISEYYSRDMSIKTKSAKYAKMQRGEYQSKVCPYGYRKSADGRMEPNPETAAVVQLIFQLAATGIGAAAVTRELFKRGIPTPGEYKAAHGQQYHDVSRSRGRWSSSTVLRILEDERYIGSYVIGRRAVIEVGGTRSRRKDRDKWFIIPDHHPAIVDKELFEKVQDVQRRFSLPTKKAREYPLKGKVYCGCCDHALSRIAQKRPFYMCRHSTADLNSRCRDVRADAAGLEEAVLLTLKKQLEVLLPVHEDGTIHLEATAAKCSEYEKQLEALKDQKQALFERYLLGQIELDTYKSEKAVYDTEILKVKNAYAAVTAQAKLKREEQARQSSRQEIAHSIAEADVLTSELTDLLIEKVYVFPDNRIEIVYKIHDLFE